MKIYKGKRVGPPEGLPLEEPNDVIVTVNDKHLEHHIYHSPTGFSWGYGGSGPADLARSILWDFFGTEPMSNMYQDFKWKFIAGWGDEWEIDFDDIKKWIIERYGKDYYNYLNATDLSDPRD